MVVWYRHQETLNRHADYKQSIAQLRDVVLQVLQTRRSEGVQPGDRDLLSFMLRAQLDGANADVQLTDEDLVYELQGTCIMC